MNTLIIDGFTIFNYNPQRCSTTLHDGICLSYRCKDGLRKGDYDFFRCKHGPSKGAYNTYRCKDGQKKMLAALLAANIYAKVYAATLLHSQPDGGEGRDGGYLFIYSVGVVPYALEKHLEK